MTPFEFVHEIDCSREAFWEVQSDPAFYAQLYDRSNVDREVVEEREGAGGAHIQVARCTSRRHLPGFVKKLLGGDLGFSETLTVWADERRATLVVEPNLFRDRTRFHSEILVESRGEDRCRRVFRGELSISIPVIGSRIERATLRDVRRGQDLAVELARERLRVGA